MIDFLLSVLRDFSEKNLNALVDSENYLSYKELYDLIISRSSYLESKGIQNSIVILKTNLNFDSISCLISLWKLHNIVIPINSDSEKINSVLQIGLADYVISFENNEISINSTNTKITNPIVSDLISQSKPGLILFSSGSTGQPKAVLHDVNIFLSKFQFSRKTFKTLLFLQFDHIAGLDTLFYILFSGGSGYIPKSRDPFYVAKFIEEKKIEVFPTTPSYLNLLLITNCLNDVNWEHLKIITLGTERLIKEIISKFKHHFPNVQLIQKYGTSEFGSPISKTKNDDPTWIKFDKSTFNYKVVNNVLHVKTSGSMIAYLNESTDMTYDNDNWLNTGDIVIEDGDWIKILGRNSNIINVGGRKVYPEEVEELIMQIPNIEDVLVYKVANPILGHVVGAKLVINSNETLNELKTRIRRFLSEKIENYKIPVVFELVPQSLLSERFKKQR